MYPANPQAYVLAIRNPHTNPPHLRTERIVFRGENGSNERINHVAEHKRRIEALEGQGCDVFATWAEQWARGARPKWMRG